MAAMTGNLGSGGHPLGSILNEIEFQGIPDLWLQSLTSPDHFFFLSHFPLSSLPLASNFSP